MYKHSPQRTWGAGPAQTTGPHKPVRAGINMSCPAAGIKEHNRSALVKKQNRIKSIKKIYSLSASHMAPHPYGIIITFSLCYFYKSLVISLQSTRASFLTCTAIFTKIQQNKPPGLCPLCLQSLQSVYFIYSKSLICLFLAFELHKTKLWAECR